jgi:hypothetical protein
MVGKKEKEKKKKKKKRGNKKNGKKKKKITSRRMRLFRPLLSPHPPFDGHRHSRASHCQLDFRAHKVSAEVPVAHGLVRRQDRAVGLGARVKRRAGDTCDCFFFFFFLLVR